MNNMKILVLGASGMLGNAVFHYLANQRDLHVYATLRNESNRRFFPESRQEQLIAPLDILNADQTIAVLKQVKPDVIINCVGIIKQLSEAADPLTVLPINAMLPHRLNDLCALINARLIHISTDCVFSGSKGQYKETDHCDAQDLYGISKWIGEVSNSEHAITLRTSIIGHELNSNHALINWFLAQEEEVHGYTEAIFSGLPTVELAKIIHEYVLPQDQLKGLYHVSAEPIDKYTLLSLVREVYHKTIHIKPDARFKIDRSLDSSCFKEATGYVPPSWSELIIKMKNFG